MEDGWRSKDVATMKLKGGDRPNGPMLCLGLLVTCILANLVGKGSRRLSEASALLWIGQAHRSPRYRPLTTDVTKDTPLQLGALAHPFNILYRVSRLQEGHWQLGWFDHFVAPVRLHWTELSAGRGWWGSNPLYD